MARDAKYVAIFPSGTERIEEFASFHSIAKNCNAKHGVLLIDNPLRDRVTIGGGLKFDAAEPDFLPAELVSAADFAGGIDRDEALDFHRGGRRGRVTVIALVAIGDARKLADEASVGEALVEFGAGGEEGGSERQESQAASQIR